MRRSVNCSRFIKNNTLPHIFLYCYNGLISGGAYIRGGFYMETLLCWYFFGLIYVGLIFRVFNVTVISVSFTVCNNNKSSVTLGIVLLLLLLSLNMLLVSYILLDILWNKLCFIAIFVIIFFVVATQQALSWSFTMKTFLKLLFRSFCWLAVCHAIR